MQFNRSDLEAWHELTRKVSEAMQSAAEALRTGNPQLACEWMQQAQAWNSLCEKDLDDAIMIYRIRECQPRTSPSSEGGTTQMYEMSGQGNRK